ncbi:MAG: uncharacterized protein JWP97_3930 [Labilithrix sp.]|nr:uncharacterized protein [Labilithrix sp.]
MAVLVALLGGTSAARASDPTDEVGGVITPASPPGDTARTALDALLFVPRTLVRAAVLASTATASFFENQQVVPRSRQLLASEDGAVRVVPTLSLASGYRPDLGARIATQRAGFASMLRGDFVGRDQYVVEARLLQAMGDRGRTQLVLEGFHERHLGAYGGVGTIPTRDGRNDYLPSRVGGYGNFLEERERIIAAVGTRFAEDWEGILSSSFQRRDIEDSPAGGQTIGSTFYANTVPGAYARSERIYTEVTIRRDTRAVRGPPAAGLLVEGYAGGSNDVHGTYASAVHSGGRVAWFIPVVRKTSILSPRLQLDIVSPLGMKGLPFREYAYATGFRGQDGRADRVAALVSVDYRWQLRSYVAARVFVDATTVAPTLPKLSPAHLAWATGFAVDLHSSQTLLGRAGVAFSPDAVELFFVFGLADPGFGDRQHR